MEILAKDMYALADLRNKQLVEERKRIEDKMREDIQARIVEAARRGAYALRLDSYLKELKAEVKYLDDAGIRRVWRMMILELKDNGFCIRTDDATATVYWVLSGE